MHGIKHARNTIHDLNKDVNEHDALIAINVTKNILEKIMPFMDPARFELATSTV